MDYEVVNLFYFYTCAICHSPSRVQLVEHRVIKPVMNENTFKISTGAHDLFSPSGFT